MLRWPGVGADLSPGPAVACRPPLAILGSAAAFSLRVLGLRSELAGDLGMEYAGHVEPYGYDRSGHT